MSKPDYVEKDGFVRRKPSLTERIAGVGVAILVMGLFAGLFLYGLVRCEEAFTTYNDVIVEEGKQWKP